MKFKDRDSFAKGCSTFDPRRLFRVAETVVVRPHDLEDCGELRATVLEVRPTSMRVRAVHDCGSHPHPERIREGDEFDISFGHVFSVVGAT